MSAYFSEFYSPDELPVTATRLFNRNLLTSN